MEITPEIIIAILSAVVIISLLLQVLLQRGKIKELERPRYGFLGKPLAAIAITGVLAGSLGFGLFLNNQDSAPNPISADQELLVVVTFTEGANSSYTFRAKPIIESVDWGNDPTLNFDVFWTVTNDEGKQTDFIESQVSQLSPSNITIQLDSGVNVVTAKLVIGTRVVSETVTVEN